LAAIDFITALGRLLHNGSLRDAFAHNAGAFMREIDLRESDRAAFVRLAPADLEFQARVLLRKRFDHVQAALPQTCRALGGRAWPEFQRHGRSSAPTGPNAAMREARDFATHLARSGCPALHRAELNRVRFACEARRLAVYFVMMIPSAPTAQGRRPALQVLLRRRGQPWCEWSFYFGW
jgi:hypothetical protein